MQDGRKAVWSIPYVSVAFFPSLKHNFISYRSSKVSDCIFEIPQLWQSGFSRVYSNSCCSCSFEAEIIKIGQSSHKMHSNKILNFQESTAILNAHLKKVCKLIVYTLYIRKKYRVICIVCIRHSLYGTSLASFYGKQFSLFDLLMFEVHSLGILQTNKVLMYLFVRLKQEWQRIWFLYHVLLCFLKHLYCNNSFF